MIKSQASIIGERKPENWILIHMSPKKRLQTNKLRSAASFARSIFGANHHMQSNKSPIQNNKRIHELTIAMEAWVESTCEQAEKRPTNKQNGNRVRKVERNVNGIA
jgi:hypothetical protein